MFRNHFCAVLVAIAVLVAACGTGSDNTLAATEAPPTTGVRATVAKTSTSPLLATTTTLLAPSAAWPPARGYHALAYDSESDIILMVGGSTGSDPMSTLADAWILDPSEGTWIETDAPAGMRRSAFEPLYSPSPMAYDERSDRIIYLQTAAQLELDEVGTWSYDANTDTWTDLAPDIQPSLGYGASMAYDSESARMIAFGGAAWTGSPGDRAWPRVWTAETWAYDYDTNTWERLRPEPRPPAVSFHTMAYDAESDRVVLFGLDSEAEKAVLWVYDYNTNVWEERAIRGSAGEAADYSRAVYHPSTDRIVIFGGVDRSEQPSNAAWLYDLNADEMTAATPNDLSGPLARHGMVYVGSLDQIFVFGGTSTRPVPGAWFSWERGPTAACPYHDGLWAYEPVTDTWMDARP